MKNYKAFVSLGAVVVVGFAIYIATPSKISTLTKCILVGGHIVSRHGVLPNEFKFKSCALLKPRMDSNLMALDAQLACEKSKGEWLVKSDLESSNTCRPYNMYRGRAPASTSLGDFCNCGPGRCWFSTEDSKSQGQCVNEPKWHRAFGDIYDYNEYLK